MPRKRFGQHFLEPVWVDKVVQAIAPTADELFLEVGPGLGALTRPLSARARHVVAIEIDRDLAAGLRADIGANLTVMTGDVLEMSPADLVRPFGRALDEASLRAVGNLPYNVASPILFRLVGLYEGGLPIRDAVVMVQLEVANRIVAAPQTRDYGVLSVQLRHVADTSRVLILPPGAFRPAPKVTSALIQLRFHPPDPPVRSLRGMRALVRLLFAQRRKMMLNALTSALEAPRGAAADVLGRAGIDGSRRPETLLIAEFARLSDVIEGTTHVNLMNVRS